MKARRLRLRLITTAAALIVVAATLSAVFRAAVVIVPGYRQQLAQWAGAALGHPVRIGAMNLLWHGFQPILELDDVQLIGARGHKAMVSAARMRLGVSVVALFRGRVQPSDLSVSGLQIGLESDGQGHVTIEGAAQGPALPGGAFRGEVLAGAQRFDAIHIEGSRISLSDPRLGERPMPFDVLRADLVRQGDLLHLQASLRPPRTLAQSLTLNATVQGIRQPPRNWHADWQLALRGLSAEGPWLARLLAPGDHILLSGASFDADGSWAAGRFDTQQFDFSATRIQALHERQSLAQLDNVEFGARAQPEGNGWKIAFVPVHVAGSQGNWPARRWQLNLRGTPASGLSLDFAADFLRLDDLAPWLALWHAAPAPVQRLRTLHGDLHDVQFSLWPADPNDLDVPGQGEPAPYYALTAAFSRLGLPSAGDAPGFAGLSGTLSLDRDGGRLALAGTPLQLTVPAALDQPVDIDALTGALRWRRGTDGWHIATDDLNWRLLNAAGSAHFDLRLPQQDGASPVLDLQTDFSCADAAQLKGLMPKTWGPNARAWMRRAIEHVAVPHGRLVLQGPLADYPFVEQSDGNWSLDLDLAEGELAYVAGWPPLEDVKAHLQITGRSLSVDADAGHVGAARVDQVHGAIADFNGAPILINGTVHGDAGDFYQVLRNSPLQKRFAGLLARTDAQGPAQLALQLDIPLHGDKDQGDDKDKVRAAGSFALQAATLAVKGLDAPIRDVAGRIDFGSAIQADHLTGRLHDLALNGRIVSDATDPDGRLEVNFDAPVPAGLPANPAPATTRAASLPPASSSTAKPPAAPGATPSAAPPATPAPAPQAAPQAAPKAAPKAAPQALPRAVPRSALATYLPPWILSELSGSAHWTASMPFSGTGAGVLSLRSDLQGLASRLPPPLRKSADERLPLVLRIGGDAAAPLRLLIGLPDTGCGQLCIALRFTGAAKTLQLRGLEAHFGDDAVPTADADGIVVTGRPATLDLGSWIGFVYALPGGSTAGTTGAAAGTPAGAAAGGNASTGSPGGPGSLALKRIDLTPGWLTEGGYRLPSTHLQLAPDDSGAGNAWSLTADGAGAAGRVAWSRTGGGQVTARFERLSVEPIPQPAGAAAGEPAPQAQPQHDIVDPTQAPTLDIDVTHLQVGGSDFGRFTMSTSRIADGQSIDAFKLDGELLHVDSHGSWRRAAGASSADNTFTMSSTDLRTALKAFGYAPSLTGKQAHISGQLSWPGSPAGLDFAQAEGKVKLEVDNGALTVVDPGAGRMLGLLNLYALPRRLTLNFSDVVSKGLGFDRLEGSFRIGGGNAVTDNLQILAPSVKMQIHGRIGLAARDYDEHVTVYPGISTGAVVGAGLAGGPIGVAIALVAQQLFNKPLDRLTQFSYHVTGSWDNPQILRGDSKTVEAAPAGGGPKP